MINEKTQKYGEACEFLLNSPYFIAYQEMLKEELANETAKYLRYEDANITPEREDANRREYKGGLRLLQRVIELPEKKKEEVKAARNSTTESSKRG